MPVIIPANLPAKNTLERENIFVMGEVRALRQDIRPLKIAILNLMPTKIVTETQLLRLLGNSALQVEITLLNTLSHPSTHTSKQHLLDFYQNPTHVRDQKFDGLIITGAPVEHLEFKQVNYWRELQEILDWSEENVYSTFHICWAAQAALYHRYAIPKYPLDQKMFGVYPHHVLSANEKLLRGFDDHFCAPHSRHTEIRHADIQKIKDLDILAASEEAGVYIIASKDRRQFYITGHSEYDPFTLKDEYERDLKKGLDIQIPKNYFPQDDPSKSPMVQWRGHAHLLYSNWLNYYVYQMTPYELDVIPKGNTPTSF